MQNTETGLASVKAIVTKDGEALQYASEEMKDNAAIVQAAVEKNGVALEYASNEMKNNEAIVREAMECFRVGTWTRLRVLGMAS